MSLRAANLSLLGDDLQIQFKTQFAKKSVNTPEILAILQSAFAEM